MVRVFAWAFVVIFATAITVDAMALTLKKGEVLTKDGVMHATATKTGKAHLERDGYIISGGQVHVGVAGETISIDIAKVSGKSKNEVAELIGTEITDQLSTDALSSLTTIGNEVAQRLGDEAAEELTREIAEDIANGIGTDALAAEFADIISRGADQGEIDAFHDRNPGLSN